MKRVTSIVLCALLCAAMLVGCAKNVVYEEAAYRFTYDSNLWTLRHHNIDNFGIGETVAVLPKTENSFSEQQENKMEPIAIIYEYAGKSGKDILKQYVDEFYGNRLQNPSYPGYTFTNLAPADDMAFEMPYWYGEDDLYTMYCCSFDTSEGSIVIECQYISDKTWREMQKILNTLEIL